MDLETEKVIKEVVAADDVTCLKSNKDFIVVGSIKGKIYVYNYDLKLL